MIKVKKDTFQCGVNLYCCKM